MKQAVRALKPFTRNLDGRLVVGHPQHRRAAGRVTLVSPEAAATLEGDGLAEQIDMATYFAEIQKEEDEGEGPGPERRGPSIPREVRKFFGALQDGAGGERSRRRDPQARRRAAAARGQTGSGRSADAVRRERTAAVGGDGTQEPSVTMKKTELREIAEKRGVDLAAFDAAKNNRERVAMIKGVGGGQGGTEMSETGRIAQSGASSTNHPGTSTPHAPGTAGAGLSAPDDAAPTGGGGTGGAGGGA